MTRIALILVALATRCAADVVRIDTLSVTIGPTGSAIVRVDISNLVGSVDVVGTARTDVKVIAVRRTRVRADGAFGQADSSVTLETRSVAGRVIVFVDAPWRVPHGLMGQRMWKFGFDVEYDLTIEVPESVELAARTSDEGDVRVSGVVGPMILENINGDIKAVNIRSVARMETVNGRIEASFDSVPDDDCAFRTVNGRIEAAFPASLSGTFAVGSMTGDIYTDFDVTPAPRRPIMVQQGRTWKRYSSAALTRVTVGGNGPEYRFETLNGAIYILKRS